MLRVAERKLAERLRAGTARLVKGSADELPFGDGEFSAATAVFAPCDHAEVFGCCNPAGVSSWLTTTPDGRQVSQPAVEGGNDGPRPSIGRCSRTPVSWTQPSAARAPTCSSAPASPPEDSSGRSSRPAPPGVHTPSGLSGQMMLRGHRRSRDDQLPSRSLSARFSAVWGRFSARRSSPLRGVYSHP